MSCEEIVREGYLEGFDILAVAHRKVHAAESAGIHMPRLTDTIIEKQIEHLLDH